MKDGVCVDHGHEHVHPGFFHSFLGYGHAADPAKQVCSTSVCLQELEQAPQEDALRSLDEVRAHGALEVSNTIGSVLQQVSVQQRLVHQGLAF